MKSKAITTIMIMLFLASMLSMAFVAPVAATPDSSIVGLWHFDTVDTTVTPNTTPDSSGQGNTGYLYPVVSPPTLVDGRFGKALSFDNVNNNYVEASRTGMDKTKGTFELWVKPLDLTIKPQAFMVVSTVPGIPHNYQIQYWTDGKLYFRVNKAGQEVSVLATGVGFTQGEWHHLAMTWDSSGVVAYVDGSPVGLYTGPMTFANDLVGDLFIGGWFDDTGAWGRRSSKAIIDEVRIWNVALTPAEIAFNYGLGDVGIDIKPGSDPNSINLGDKGLLPVAILGSADFDVTTINPETIELEGVGVTTRGKAQKLAYSFEDVSGDGYTDLIAFFSIPQLVEAYVLIDTKTALTLTANLYPNVGLAMTGTDSVRVVPP